MSTASTFVASDADGYERVMGMFFDTAAALDAQGAERRARNFSRPLTRPGELASAWHAAGLRDGWRGR